MATDKKILLLYKNRTQELFLLLWPSEGIGSMPLPQLSSNVAASSHKQTDFKKKFNAYCSITENKIFPNPNEDKEVEASASVPIIDTQKPSSMPHTFVLRKAVVLKNSSI